LQIHIDEELNGVNETIKEFSENKKKKHDKIEDLHLN
jgi:hypothetical protein